MPRLSPGAGVLAFAAAMCLTAVAHAQTLHLPPVFRPVLPKGEVVLTLRVKECGTDIMSVGVRSGQLLLARRNGTVDEIQLANRTIKDVLTDLGAKYPTVFDLLDSDYRDLDATLLEEGRPQKLECDESEELTTAKRALEDARKQLERARQRATDAEAAITAADDAHEQAARDDRDKADAAMLASERTVEDAASRLARLSKTIDIGASPGEPDVAFGFGLVMSPSTTAATTTSDTQTERTGLLSQAGFQLDLIGTHLFWRPTKPQPGEPARGPRYWMKPSLYGQARLGLHGNQQLNVGNNPTRSDSDTNAQTRPPAGSQVEAAIQQAQQVAVTAQMPLAWNVVTDRMDFVLTPNIGITWTVLDPFVFPKIKVGSDFKTVGDLFPADDVSAAERTLNRTLPFMEGGVQGTFHFRRDNAMLFYFGAGLIDKETPQRAIVFTRPASAGEQPNRVPTGAVLVRRTCGGSRCPLDDPQTFSLDADFLTPRVRYWQVMFGWRMAGLVDLRVDAAGPVQDRNGEPLLRVVIGRSFPVANEN